ncbi:MAG: AAA family ATPase [Chitinivibrionales bacterium]|nr:AAA family ATPase [Chitinivibrionales bacterium]
MIRIQRLHFANLGAFNGEWIIDLTEPLTDASGPLVISGASGSGKTVLLDALCLALYGRALRDNLPQSSRTSDTQSSQRFAALTFATDQQLYRCSWRKEQNGTVERELAALPDAAPVAVGPEPVDHALTDLGLGSFEQFTASTVLSPETVLSFLKASPAGRMAILEECCGDGMHAQVASALQGRLTHYRTTAEELRARIANVTVLDEQRERVLRDRLAGFQLRAETAASRHPQLAEALVRLDAVTRTEHECTIAVQERDAHLADWEEARPERERLERAREAGKLQSTAPPVAQLKSKCEQQERALHELEQQRATVESSLTEAREQHETAEAELRAARDALSHEGPAIGKTREIDVAIDLLTKTLAALDRRSGELNKTRTDVVGRITRTERSRDQTVLGRKREEQYLTAHGRDAHLGTELAGIARAFESLAHAHELHTASRDELGMAVHAREQAATAYAQREREHERTASALEQAARSQTKLVHSLERLLGGRTPRDWERSLDESRQQRSLLTQLDGWYTEHTATQRRLAQLESSRKERRQTHERLQSEERTLLGRAQRTEEARMRPRAAGRGNRGPGMAAEENPEQLMRDLRGFHDQLSELRAARAALEAELSHDEASLQQTRNHLTTLEQSIQDGLRRLRLPTDMRTAAYRLRSRSSEIERDIRLATDTVAQTQQLQKQERDAAERVDAARETEREARTALLLARRELEAAEKERARLTQRSEQAGRREARMQKEALDLVEPYAIRALPINRLDMTLKQLARRRDDWRRHDEARAEQAERERKLDGELKAHRQLLESVDDDAARVSRDAETSREELHRHERLRRQTFGDRDPEKEQARLESTVTAAERACTEARGREERLARELLELNHRVRTAADALEQRRQEAETVESDYQSRIRQAGFTDEADVEAALLPAEELAQLAQRQKALADKQAALEDKLRSVRAAYAILQANAPSEGRPQLERELTHAATRLARAREAAGAVKRELNENERARACRHRLAATLETCQQEYAHCEELERLMGGPDGRAYRSVAQQPAFHAVVKAANRYLACLSDRYLFTDATDAPLTLAVIDACDLGTKSPAADLSGSDAVRAGLALTLGLAEVVTGGSPALPVFIDDCTADLDMRHTEIFMDSLTRLCRAGLPVAVTTRADALADRSGAHIAVVHDARGRSTLVGPGCSRRRPPAPPAAGRQSPAPASAPPDRLVEPDSEADVLAVVEQQEDPLDTEDRGHG